MGDDDDATNMAMVHIQESNDVSTHFLLHHGYDGNAFNDRIKKISKTSVTVRHSAERIEKIQQATTHDNLFHATGGGHLTDDDIFLSAQKKVVETEIKKLQKRKKSAGKMLDVERKAKEILVQTKSLQTYNIAELRVLLTYYQVK
jgi:selenophosphate synthase